MELLLIRHGEPERHDDPAKRADPGLSERGRRQAELAGDYLLPEGIEALYTSPLRRAVETVAFVSQASGMPASVREDLAEFDRDAPEYLHFEDLIANGDPRYAAFLRDDLSAWGTDAQTFRARVNAEMEQLIAMNPGRRIAVVTHGGVINAYVGGLIGADRLSFHQPAYTGIARVMASRGGVREIVSINETAHLRGHDLGVRARPKGSMR